MAFSMVGLMYYDDATVMRGKFINNFPASICRAIINTDYFEIFIGLINYTI